MGDDGEMFETEDPLIGGVLYAAENLLHRLADADEWELAPMVYIVAHGPAQQIQDLPEEVRDQHDDPDGFGMQLALLPLEIPEYIWAGGEPHRVLEAMAEALAEGGPPPLPFTPEQGGRVLGALFVSEAWALLRPQDADEDWADRLRESDTPVSEHPDRTEVRIAHLIDVAHQQFSLVLPRGGDQVQITPSSHGMGVQGRIPDALGKVVAALVDDIDSELADFTQG